MFPSVSIIIAVKTNNRNLEECVKNVLALEYPFFEIVILPDEKMGFYTDKRVSVVATGSILPAAKRDIGASHANGEILAFIDDDTYPVREWLKHAVLNFKDASIACVGGPAITPKDEPLRNKASGRVYESIIVSGPARFRYVAMRRRFTDDFPSCNFLIRREIFQKIGGFNTKFWPGEDTVLCLEVVHTMGKKIIYDPQVLMYHHRRPLFKKHYEQIASYALHRGYFVKRFPKTSFKVGYFLPSIIVATLIVSFIGGLCFHQEFFYVLAAYVAVVALCSLHWNIVLALYTFFGIMVSHCAYGINFIKGLCVRTLKEENT